MSTKTEHEAWLRVSSEVTAMTNKAAGRDNLVAVVEPGVETYGAPAVHIPAIGEIRIDPENLMRALDPEDVDLASETGRLAEPVLTGAAGHEASHAAHSKWFPPKGTPNAVAQTATMLEESRCEGKLVSDKPEWIPYIRAAISEVVKTEGADSDVSAAAGAAALVLARVDTGILDASEVKPLREAVEGVVTAETLDTLEGIWRDFQALPDEHGDAEALDLARKWLDALGIDEDAGSGGFVVVSCSHGSAKADVDAKVAKGEISEEDGEAIKAAIDAAAATATGEPGEGKGTTSGSAEQENDDEGEDSTEVTRGEYATGQHSHSDTRGGVSMGAATIAEAMGEITAKVETDAQDSAARTARQQRILAARAEAAKMARVAGKKAKDVFGPGVQATTYGGGVNKFREPTGEERAMANTIAKGLRKAKFRADSRVTVPTQLPPGRLSGQGAMVADIQRARGEMVAAKPWKKAKYLHHDEPPVSVGIGVDVSGSMGWATSITTSLAWALARAVERVEGRMAAVTYGQTVRALIMPGDRPKKVAQFSAPDGTEKYVEAVTALDGALDLRNGDGARMLVLITDHAHTAAQLAAGDAYVKMLMDRGVKVLFLNLGHSYYIPEWASFVNLDDPTKLGTMVADALVKAVGQA